jgi:MYXO-CTERM domain-containing protein
MTLRVGFEVVRVWKGIHSEGAVVLTPSDSAACGVLFEAGQSYLVYASSEGGVLRANNCGGSKPITEADDDLAAIGMGATPFEPREPAPDPEEEEPPAAGGCASCSASRPDGPGAAATLLLFALLAIRPLRRALR